MFQRILKVGLLSLVVSVIPSNFQVANSTEILWNPGVSNALYGTGPGLAPGAGTYHCHQALGPACGSSKPSKNKKE